MLPPGAQRVTKQVKLPRKVTAAPSTGSWSGLADRSTFFCCESPQNIAPWRRKSPHATTAMRHLKSENGPGQRTKRQAAASTASSLAIAPQDVEVDQMISAHLPLRG